LFSISHAKETVVNSMIDNIDARRIKTAQPDKVAFRCVADCYAAVGVSKCLLQAPSLAPAAQGSPAVVLRSEGNGYDVVARDH